MPYVKESTYNVRSEKRAVQTHKKVGDFLARKRAIKLGAPIGPEYFRAKTRRRHA
jgi:hypothetical protein